MTDEPTTEHVAVRWRIPAAIGMVVAGIGVAAVIVGATTGGTAAKDATAAAVPAAQLLNAPSASPGASQAPSQDGDGWAGPDGRMGGRELMGGRMGGRGMMGDIAITGIAGSQLSLKTIDGWTRTIDATGATIEKDGKTMTLADLKVGDQIRFEQTRNTDGSYKITAIAVVQPHVAGTVQAVDASTITITQRDGTTTKVQLTGSTTYASGRTAADKSAVTVGSLVMIRGTVAADGTFTATAVEVRPAADPTGGPEARPDHDKNGNGPNGNGPNGPDANPSPSPAASVGGA